MDISNLVKADKNKFCMEFLLAESREWTRQTLIKDYQHYGDIVFKGRKEDVNRLYDHLKKNAQAKYLKSCRVEDVDENVQELYTFGYVFLNEKQEYSVDEVMKQFPELKMAAFIGSHYSAYVCYSESGCDFWSFNEYIGGYSLPKGTDIFVPWIYEKYPFDTFKISKERVDYAPPAFIVAKWMDNQFAFFQDGEYYYYKGFEPQSFIIQNGTLISAKNAVGDVIVPDGVKHVNESAFYHNDNITSVVFPQSVVEVDRWAFFSCNNLTSIVFKNDDIQFNTEIFWYCNAIKTIEPLGCLTKYNNTLIEKAIVRKDRDGYCFSGCSELKEVIFEDGVTELPSFRHCKSLANLVLPDSIISVAGVSAALCGTGIKEFTMPSSLSYIQDYMFDASQLNSFTWPERQIRVYPYAFAETKIEVFEIPGYVTEVPEGLLHKCNNLTSVVLKEGVKKIGKYAFSDCPVLTDVYFPKTMLKSCHKDAFVNSPNVLVHVPEGCRAIAYLEEKNSRYVIER